MLPALVLVILVTYGQVMLTVATVFMLLFRKKYPRAWFNWQVEMSRFSARFNAYTAYLRDEYPATDDEQAVTLDVDYPDVETDLSRGLPLIKWLLAIPHLVVLVILGTVQILTTLIAWVVIIFAGFYPRPLFNFSVGVYRWGARVNGYVLWLNTDRYPPFSLS